MNLIELVFLLTCHEWKSCCAGLSHHKGPLRLQLVGREIKLVPAPSSMILQNMWIADGIRTIYPPGSGLTRPDGRLHKEQRSLQGHPGVRKPVRNQGTKRDKMLYVYVGGWWMVERGYYVLASTMYMKARCLPISEVGPQFLAAELLPIFPLVPLTPPQIDTDVGAVSHATMRSLRFHINFTISDLWCFRRPHALYLHPTASL